MVQDRMQKTHLTLSKTHSTQFSSSPKRTGPSSLSHWMHNLHLFKQGGGILHLEVQLAPKATHFIDLNMNKVQFLPAHKEHTVLHYPHIKRGQRKTVYQRQDVTVERPFVFAQLSSHLEELTVPHLEVHTAHPVVHSFPWSSAGMAPFQRASVLQKTDGEIRLSRAGVSCTAASEDSSACNLVTQWMEQTIISAKYPEVPLDTHVLR